MTTKPADFLRFMPFLPSVFGKAELEFAAVIVILWHVDQGLTVWTGVSPKTVVEWALKTEMPLMVRLRTNPFFSSDFHGLQKSGFVWGWEEPTEVGGFSESGLARLAALLEKTGAG